MVAEKGFCYCASWIAFWRGQISQCILPHVATKSQAVASACEMRHLQDEVAEEMGTDELTIQGPIEWREFAGLYESSRAVNMVDGLPRAPSWKSKGWTRISTKNIVFGHFDMFSVVGIIYSWWIRIVRKKCCRFVSSILENSIVRC